MLAWRVSLSLQQRCFGNKLGFAQHANFLRDLLGLRCWLCQLLKGFPWLAFFPEGFPWLAPSKQASKPKTSQADKILVRLVLTSHLRKRGWNQTYGLKPSCKQLGIESLIRRFLISATLLACLLENPFGKQASQGNPYALARLAGLVPEGNFRQVSREQAS